MQETAEGEAPMPAEMDGPAAAPVDAMLEVTWQSSAAP